MTITATRHRTLLIILLLVEVCSAFEVSMIYAALPTLNREFGDPSSVSWVITSCFLVSAIAAALCGRLGDLLGRRQLLLIVLLTCGTGSMISALSGTLTGVIVGAALQGVSGAVLALCFGLARQWLSPAMVPSAVGTIVAAAALGAGLGLVLGGFIVDHFSWNSMFFVSGAYAFVCAFLAWYLIPADIAKAQMLRRIDLGRGIIFAPAVCGLLLVINLGSRWGWDWRIGALFVGSCALLVYWARHQLGAETPLINLRLLANRKIITAYACMALVAIGTMQIALVMSMFFQQPEWTGVGFALGAAAAGAMLLPSNLMGLVASPLSGRLAGRYGARRALLIGAALLVAGWGGMLSNHVSLVLSGTLIVVAAFGFAMAYAAIPNLLIEAVPESHTSEVTGISSVVRATFMAVGSQVVGVVMGLMTVTSPQGDVQLPGPLAFQTVFAYIAFCSFLCLLLAWSLPARSREAEASDGVASSENIVRSGRRAGVE